MLPLPSEKRKKNGLEEVDKPQDPPNVHGVELPPAVIDVDEKNTDATSSISTHLNQGSTVPVGGHTIVKHPTTQGKDGILRSKRQWCVVCSQKREFKTAAFYCLECTVNFCCFGQVGMNTILIYCVIDVLFASRLSQCTAVHQ